MQYVLSSEVSIHFFRQVIQGAGSGCEGGSVIHHITLKTCCVLQFYRILSDWGREIGRRDVFK